MAIKSNVINHDIFNIIDTEQKAYYLGMLFARGYFHINYSLKVYALASEEDFLLKFRSFLKCDSEFGYADGTKDGKYKRVYITVKSMQIVNDLVYLGWTLGKELRVCPANVKNTLIPHFLRGYIESDCFVGSDTIIIYGPLNLLCWIRGRLNITTGRIESIKEDRQCITIRKIADIEDLISFIYTGAVTMNPRIDTHITNLLGVLPIDKSTRDTRPAIPSFFSRPIVSRPIIYK
jgi:hypothetical protein